MNAESTQVTTSAERSLSTQLAERSITNPEWHTLSKSLYPGASQASVLMVIDYCRARNLDPLKKPCHIVPMQVKVGRDYEWRDVILPGIYELRTTAIRTGLYLGHSKPEYGEPVEFMGMTVPAWCDLVIYRWNDAAKLKAEFPVRTYFAEVCGTTWDKDIQAHKANARWSRAPVQMMVKCAEAAGLREAFPDELGGQMTVEEMEGQRQLIDVTPGDRDYEADTDMGPAKIGAIKMRKVVEGLDAAVKSDDPVAYLAVRNELNNAEWMLVWRQLRSWERTALNKLDDKAKTLPPKDLVQWALTAIETSKSGPDLLASWDAVQGAFQEADQEVPADIETVYLDRKQALAVP